MYAPSCLVTSQRISVLCSCCSGTSVRLSVRCFSQPGGCPVLSIIPNCLFIRKPTIVFTRSHAGRSLTAILYHSTLQCVPKCSYRLYTRGLICSCFSPTINKYRCVIPEPSNTITYGKMRICLSLGMFTHS